MSSSHEVPTQVESPKMTEKKVAEVERLFAQLGEGPISSNWELEQMDGVLCNHCFESFHPSNFPIVEGRCGHTICGDCFSLVKKKSSSGTFLARCLVTSKCASGAFNVVNPRFNKVAMTCVSRLVHSRNAATKEMHTLHERWNEHASILDATCKDLKDENSSLAEDNKELLLLRDSEKESAERANALAEETQKEQHQTLKNTVDAWKKKWKRTHLEQHKLEMESLAEIVDQWKSDCQDNKEMIAQMKDVILHLEAGKQYYYLRCPLCQKHMQKIPRNYFSNPLPPDYLKGEHAQIPRDDIPSITGWHEVDDFAPFGDLALWEQMEKSQPYKNMRKHLKAECVPKQKQQEIEGYKNDMVEYFCLKPAEENELPSFYRESCTSPSISNKRKHEESN